jgi:hypothetical protein
MQGKHSKNEVKAGMASSVIECFVPARSYSKSPRLSCFGSYANRLRRRELPISTPPRAKRKKLLRFEEEGGAQIEFRNHSAAKLRPRPEMPYLARCAKVLHTTADSQEHLEHESGERPRKARKTIYLSRLSRFFLSFAFRIFPFAAIHCKALTLTPPCHGH